ncbi:hypothetical protein LINPERHAP1_LOCUS34424, partial [Linum perenne]
DSIWLGELGKQAGNARIIQGADPEVPLHDSILDPPLNTRSATVICQSSVLR